MLRVLARDLNKMFPKTDAEIPYCLRTSAEVVGSSL